MRALFLVGALLLVLACTASAQDVTVDELYDVQALLSLAESGEPRAAFLLGSRYASGRGGVRDDSQALRWFRVAAERGLAEAQYNLGIMYADGRGVERDMSQAARWYRQAAEQGIAEAQYNLGTLYGTGVGVPQDEERAAQWLHRAADLELPQAQYNLGVLYEHGRGVRLDGRAALVWYRRAADQGYAAAADRLGALREKLKVDEWPEPVVAPGTLSEVASLVPSDRVADSEEIAESEVRVAALIEPALTKVELAEPLELPPSATRVEAGDGWLETVDPTGYTLQVASDTDEASIQRLVRELITEPAGYFASTKQGTIWYSAVVGLYDSYESAKAAIAALPPALRRAGPWVRNIGRIQAVMLKDAEG